MKTLKKAFFPVSLSDIFCKASDQWPLFGDDIPKFRRIPRFKAVIAEDILQRRAGGWIEDFVAAIESRDFNYKNYLGDYYKMVA